MKRKRLLPVVFAAGLLGVVASTGCTGRDDAKAAPVRAAARMEPIRVRTVSVETRRIDRTIDVTGSLQPDDTVSVSSDVPGKIARIPVDFGQTVRKGDIVVELERTELLIQLERSKAALAQALARIGLNPNQEEIVPSTTPAIRQAQAQLEDTRSRYESAKKLVESGDIARDRFVEIEKQLAARQAAVDAARDELRTQLANIEALRADKRLVEKNLSDTQILAPFDGQVSQRLAAPGQFIRDNTPILTIVKSWPLRLRFDVPEVAVLAVRQGRVLQFTTEAIPGQTFSATVTQINPSLDARPRSLNAEARLNQASPHLKPGMFVKVELTVEKATEVTVVPAAAVATVAGLTKVFAIRNGKAVEIRFAPGATLDGWIEVPGDSLKPPDKVAIDNVGNLTDGAAVRAN